MFKQQKSLDNLFHMRMFCCSTVANAAHNSSFFRVWGIRCLESVDNVSHSVASHWTTEAEVNVVFAFSLWYCCCLITERVLQTSSTELFLYFLSPPLPVSQGNKGGVSIRLSFYGHMLCFLNCHLAAHMRYAKERMDEFEYIMDSQKFDSQSAPRIVDHRWDLWRRSQNCSPCFCIFLKNVYVHVS